MFFETIAKFDSFQFICGTPIVHQLMQRTWYFLCPQGECVVKSTYDEKIGQIDGDIVSLYFLWYLFYSLLTAKKWPITKKLSQFLIRSLQEKREPDPDQITFLNNLISKPDPDPDQ